MGSPSTFSSGQPTSRKRLTATQLRSMWRTASRERGWRFPGDWWTPAVDAVTEAVISGGDLAERCTRLGLARAIAGVSMDETLSDVVAMAALVRALQSHPTHQFSEKTTQIEVVELVKAAAIGWAEDATFTHADGQADDLGSLPDCSYLSIRLGEVAAEAESRGSRLGEGYAFVVVSLLGPSYAEDEPLGLQERVESWDHSWQMSQLTDDVRSVFSAGETIVQAGPTRAIVLARRSSNLAAQVSALRGLIEGRRFSDTQTQPPMVGIWVEGLPDSLRQARLLLADLRR